MSLRNAMVGLGVVAALAIGFFMIEGFLNGQQPTTSAPPADAPNVPSESVIGEWEDTVGSWTQRIRIVKYAGLLVREIHYPGGRMDRDVLREVTPHRSELRRFENLSSQNGQTYAITRFNHLAVYDDDGYVGIAINIATKGDLQ